jgi:hypothetical protein
MLCQLTKRDLLRRQLGIVRCCRRGAGRCACRWHCVACCWCERVALCVRESECARTIHAQTVTQRTHTCFASFAMIAARRARAAALRSAAAASSPCGASAAADADAAAAAVDVVVLVGVAVGATATAVLLVDAAAALDDCCICKEPLSRVRTIHTLSMKSATTRRAGAYASHTRSTQVDLCARRAITRDRSHTTSRAAPTTYTSRRSGAGVRSNSRSTSSCLSIDVA